MKAFLSNFVRNSALFAAAVLALGPVRTPGADKALGADAFPAFDSYIKLSGYAPAISGNDAAYQKRNNRSSDGGLGIEDLHLSKDLASETSMEIDGRALTGAEDYLGKIKFSKNEVGTVEAGFTSFRTFSDGVGGFFPTSGRFLALTNQDLHLDRAKFWAEATLNLPKMPVVSLKYVNETRKGKKDSTIWGSSDFTGLPFNLAPNPINPARKMAPSYLDLDERHQELEATIKHSVGNTTLLFTALHEKVDNLDTRLVTNYPGEVIPWSIASLATAAQPAAKAGVDASNWNNQQDVRQSDGIKSSTTAFTGKVETVINDMFTLNLDGSFQLLHAAFSGDRPIVTLTPTSGGPTPISTATFAGLTGNSRVKVYTGSLALDIKPTQDLFVKVAVRAEDEYIRGASTYNVLAASGTPAVNVATTTRVGWAKIKQHSATPVIQARYTASKSLSFYFNGSLRDLSGEEKNTSAFNPVTAQNGTLANNNLSEDHGNYALGANWRPAEHLNVRAEVFRKHHQFESTGFAVNLGDYYLLDSDFTGAKLTVIAKPAANLTSTSRYVYQSGQMQVTGYLPTFPAYDSCDAKNHTLSETVDWTPNTQCYVQLNGTMVFNTIGTIYPRAGVTPATSTNSSFDTNRILQDSNNNYVTASVIGGWVIDKKTDAQLQYTYYRANNGDAFLADLTMPYGAASEESVVTVGVKRKLSDKMMFNAKVGYCDSKNDTNGGFTNFRGPLAYLSFDYAL